MSIRAISWALSAKVDRSSTKFVLVAMCNYANEFGECYPSAKQLSDDTAQDIKTVESNLKRLREMGFIEDTGERRGNTKQVIVYRITHPKTGDVKVETPPKLVELNAPEIGGAGETNTPVFPDNTPVFPDKDPRFSGETPPKTGDGTVMEPSMNRQGTSNTAQALIPPDVEKSVWQDFVILRKAKKAPLTKTAVEGLRREADKAGLTINAAIRVCCENGWQGFKAAWYENMKSKNNKASGETAYQRSMRERVAEFSPSIAKQAPGDYPLDNMTLEATNVVAIASH